MCLCHRYKYEFRAKNKIGKTFTETLELMKKVYGDDCLSRARVHEWFTRFRHGREDINDDEHTGRPKSVITENSIEIVREFIENEPKSSLKFMESELNISKTLIYRILTDHLGLRKVCARFVFPQVNWWPKIDPLLWLIFWLEITF